MPDEKDLEKKIKVLEQQLSEKENIIKDPSRRGFYALCRIMYQQIEYLENFNFKEQIASNPKDDKVYDRAKGVWEGMKTMIADSRALRAELGITAKEEETEMKKITSSFVIFIAAPIRFIKKIKLDNFLGGLILGAVFSLIVNVVTVKITDEIQKQRVLEAVENEIVNNQLRAQEVIKRDQEDIGNNTTYNALIPIERYSKDIWQYSPVSLQFIAQLDPSIQSAVIGYYTISVPWDNSALDNLDRLTSSQLSNCMLSETVKNPGDSEHCRAWNNVLLQGEINTAQDMQKRSYDLLMKFHPTKDRLHSWFLKLIMGDKATKILSG